MDDRGQTVSGRIDAVAQRPQRLQQGRLGALVHPGHSRQAVTALTQANHRGQKTGRGSGVAHMQFQGRRFRARLGYASALPHHLDNAVGFLGKVGSHPHGKTHLAQALGHHLGVLAPEGPGQRDRAGRQSRQDERTIGNALGSRHRDGHVSRRWRRNDLDEVGQRHRLRRFSWTRNQDSGDPAGIWPDGRSLQWTLTPRHPGPIGIRRDLQ